MSATTSSFVATRKPIEGYLDYEGRRPHGLFSSKVKVPKSQDIFGKDVPFVSLVAPYFDPNSQKNKRDAYKGKQILTKWPHTGEYFRKLEYAPAPYDDNSKRDKTRKFGFGTGRPLNRDDLSSTIEVGRYRSQLELESKMEKTANETMMAEAKRLSDLARSRPKTAAAFGMSTAIPTFSHAFDRGQYVPEFTTKDDPRKKGERRFGTLRPMSADIGEGCAARGVLKTPEFGVKQGIAAMKSTAARPSCALKVLMPIGL